MARTLIPLPEKDNRRILSEKERKYIAYRRNRYLRYTPVWWQKRYMKVWGFVWFLGKAVLLVFVLAFFIGLTALLLGIK